MANPLGGVRDPKIHGYSHKQAMEALGVDSNTLCDLLNAVDFGDEDPYTRHLHITHAAIEAMRARLAEGPVPCSCIPTHDPAVAAPMRYDEMQPGDVLAANSGARRPRALILRTAEPYKDRIAGVERDHHAHWARLLDGPRAGREGWVPYGPGGVGAVEFNDRHRPPSTPPTHGH